MNKEKWKTVGKVVAIAATPTIIVLIVFLILYLYNRRKKKLEIKKPDIIVEKEVTTTIEPAPSVFKKNIPETEKNDTDKPEK